MFAGADLVFCAGLVTLAVVAIIAIGAIAPQIDTAAATKVQDLGDEQIWEKDSGNDEAALAAAEDLFLDLVDIDTMKTHDNEENTGTDSLQGKLKDDEEGFVGLRTESGSGDPAVDINPSGSDVQTKVHFKYPKGY